MPASYDILNSVLNTARARLRDNLNTLVPVSGNLLDTSQAATQQMCNSAWRRLQADLGGQGFVRLTKDAVIGPLPAIPTLDPAALPYINWDGYYDGQALQTTPLLPSDMIAPVSVHERPAGTVKFLETDRFMDGIPRVPKALWHRAWEWKNDALYLAGATGATDILLRYSAYLPDFVNVAADPGPFQVVGAWYVQPVPILRALDPLASYICAEYCLSVKDPDGAKAFADEARQQEQPILTLSGKES